jgi:ethanolaminephosphotransferase
MGNGGSEGVFLTLFCFFRETANRLQWLKQAQEIMSSTASNYDVTKLVTGQALAAVALFSALIAVVPTFTTSLTIVSPILGISLLYGIMMFASSYVEEEQHFWYWSTTAWLMLLWVKR